MHTKSDNIEITMGSKTDDIINELFESLLQNYQKRLEELMRESEFIVDSVDFLYYHLQKISLKRDGSYIDSSKWLKNKKVTINPKNINDDDDDDDDDDNECYKYSIVEVPHWEGTDNPQERISNLQSFLKTTTTKILIFQQPQKTGKILNNCFVKAIALKILFVPQNTKQIKLAYKSKQTFTLKNQVILLMITDGEKWHYLAVFARIT